jgi:outer membrane protein assembly factor BamB
MKLHLSVFIACLATLHSVHLLEAGDWPMSRHDAQSSGVSSAALPADLKLRWSVQLPSPRPAWPISQTKLQFDVSYQPVVMGKRLFLGSSATDAVTAYDTETGDQLWQYFTDGPVRFAPVAIKERVFAVSDDGYLYCLRATDGKLMWKVNGGPADRRVIGNDRLISSWPARGGPVYHEGRVYFAASIWSFMGIFVHAVDADTGKTIWTNSGDGTNYTVQPHGAPSFSSVVPQGRLVIAGNSLIVPGGRSTPAVFDLKTGKLRYFKFDKKYGGHGVMASGGLFYVAGRAYNLGNGDSVSVPKPALLHDDSLIVAERNELEQFDVTPAVAASGKDKTKTSPPKVSSRRKIRLTGHDLGPVTIQAGSVVYNGNGSKVAAFDLSSKEKTLSPSWNVEVKGDVWAMLAADDKLFVVTKEGALHCYGKGDAAAKTHETVVTALPASAPKWKTMASAILSSTEAEEGYCLAFGVGTGELIYELLRQSNLHVVVFDNDKKKIDHLRKVIDQTGLYGKRLAAHVGDFSAITLPSYMANLIVSVTPGEVGLLGQTLEHKASVEQLFRSIRPYGGRAFLVTSPDQHKAMAKIANSASLAGAVFKRQNDLTLITREGALPNTDDWTHQYGNAAQTVVSRDKTVKAPLGLLWFGGPSNDAILPRHGHGPSPQVAGGRLFIEGPDLIRAVDVYTGRKLWEKELKGFGKYYNVTRHFAGAGEIGSNYVSMPDHVYCVYGSDILELDAATGTLTKKFTLEPDPKNPTAKRANWGYMAVWKDYLVATSSPVNIGVADTSSKTSKVKLPKDVTAIVPRHAKWRYLAGKDPTGDWIKPEFDDASWKTGESGFGYGDGDDKTKLNMRGAFRRVYIRHTFDGKQAVDAIELGLSISFDDAFVAYLNGHEIARKNVGVGRGVKATKISSHEAGAFEYFQITNWKSLLIPGRNVIAIEGHNTSLTSSDFSLDPILVKRKKNVGEKPTQPNISSRLARSSNIQFKWVRDALYASGSRRLVVFNRHTGKKLWSRDAQFNFRHNNIAIGGGKVFCIDGLSPKKLAAIDLDESEVKAKSRFYALDIQTGKPVWSSGDNVSGTFINYSAEHDLVLQAGSQYRDRAKDETGKGMVALRGRDGIVLWKNDLTYGGPCLLWRDRIITNGGGGFAIDIKTGKPTGWTYSRNYGCNTAIGSEHLLTFRSGAAGFLDLSNNGGTGNLGGFRSSCTANLIPANGVLNAPDYTRTCSCAYQNQTSVAMIYMPQAEFWTFGATQQTGRVGINFGSPGDRRASNGTLWVDYPSVGGKSPSTSVRIEGNPYSFVRHHASRIKSGNLRWVAASSVIGIRSLTVQLPELAAGATRTVRLHFAETESAKPGERVFDVMLGKQNLLTGLDIAASTGQNKQVVKEFANLPIPKELKLTFHSKTERPPILSGIEVIDHSPDSK